jgi:hypothetical protein
MLLPKRNTRNTCCRNATDDFIQEAIFSAGFNEANREDQMSSTRYDRHDRAAPIGISGYLGPIAFAKVAGCPDRLSYSPDLPKRNTSKERLGNACRLSENSPLAEGEGRLAGACRAADFLDLPRPLHLLEQFALIRQPRQFGKIAGERLRE